MGQLNSLVLFYLLGVFLKPEGYDKADKLLMMVLQEVLVSSLKRELQTGKLTIDDLTRFQSFLEERLDALGIGSARLIGKLQGKEMHKEELLFRVAQAKDRLRQMTELLIKVMRD